MWVLCLGAWGCGPVPPDSTVPRAAVTGRVVDHQGRPVRGARVRYQADSHWVVTDAEGRFQLPVPATDSCTVTAAHPDYFIQGAAWSPDAPALRIPLSPLSADNPNYAWIDPRPEAHDAERCGNCHGGIYEEWAGDGHAQAARNPRFRNLYDGRNWHGQPGQGWSLQADYPHGQAVCWSCHLPAAEEFALPGGELPDPESIAGQGVHCDYCHKIRDLESGELGKMHGRYAVQLLRPESGQVFFGPLDDVDRGDDVYSPLQHDSRLCATCHEGVVFGVHVYRTYSEWLQSPAAQRGQQCQDCHMRPSGQMTNVAPGSGGIDRDARTLASHAFLRTGRDTMLREALDLEVRWTREENAWRADIAVRSHDVGHHLPTGYIDHHLILDLQVQDAAGQELAALEGSILPAAVGPPLAGRAGYLFGRLLQDDQQRAPAPFWRAVTPILDQTLPPDHTWQAVYRFPLSADAALVSLSYRRFWYSVRHDKSWPDETIRIHQRAWGHD